MMKDQKKQFTFKKIARLKKEKFASIRVQKLKDAADEPPWYIRGIKAGSKEEYWCSLALDKIQESTGWSWEFQKPVYGGRDTAGGNVVDFLIDTPGRKTVLDPMGRYWHTGKNEDRQQMINVCRRKNWNLIAWFTDETPSKEITYSFLRNKLNV
jgi:hypothetical protein